MEQNKKTFEICWPFYQCQATLPNAIGHDIFVWLYLSLFVHINKTEGKPPFYINNKKREEQKKRVRELIHSKFSKELIPDVLLQEIEEQIEKDFCEEINEYKDLRIRPEAESFLNSFENICNYFRSFTNTERRHLPDIIFQRRKPSADLPHFWKNSCYSFNSR